MTNKKELLYTEDLTIFKRLDWNRPVDKKHVNKILNSMETFFIVPTIYVNEKMAVLDGQHRLEACKKLSKPVHYEIIAPEDEAKFVQTLNQNNKSWKLKEFEHFHNTLYQIKDDEKYIDYKYVQDISENYNIKSDFILALIAQIEGRTLNKIKNEYQSGEFMFCCHSELNSFLNHLETFSDFKKYKTLTFMKIYASLFFNDKERYDHNIMLTNYKQNKHLFKDVSTSSQIANVLINKIYAKNSKKTRLYYLTDSRSRDKFVLR